MEQFSKFVIQIFFVICLLFENYAFEYKAGRTTRFWDCCKPTCAWNDNIETSLSPVQTYAKDGHTNISATAKNGCFAGSGFACSNQQPWMVNETLSYGFSSVYFPDEPKEPKFCCMCYELKFIDPNLTAKRMIVQATNMVFRDDEETYFNLQIPASGMGKSSNGCIKQWGENKYNWGKDYGGITNVIECNGIPHEIRDGCRWRFEWFKNADNPDVVFRQVECPEVLLEVSNCRRKPVEKIENRTGNGVGHVSKREKNALVFETNRHLYLGIPVAVLIGVGAFFGLGIWCRFRRSSASGRQDILVDSQEFSGDACITDGLNFERKRFRHYEIPSRKFRIDFTRRLGSGEFGQVYAATLIRTSGPLDVAVKILKQNTQTVMENKAIGLSGLLSEIKILAYLGAHYNIVHLVGINTAKLKSGHVFVFLEYCELGCLQKYLRNLNIHQSFTIEDNDGLKGSTDSGYTEWNVMTGQSSINQNIINDMKKWSLEILNAMVYISSKGLIHGDLATRNVLLSKCRTAKLSDFGLSRRLYSYTEYVKQSQEPLPWKWMAPESLTKLTFTEKTDVWTYGVLLWEIFSLADVPYAGLSWRANFASLLENGLRLPKPKHNVNYLFDVMQTCWEFDPVKRPTFKMLLETIVRHFDKASNTM